MSLVAILCCLLQRIYTVSQKNCALLFLSELRQISMNFNKLWQVDGKMAAIVCCIYIFHITWPTSLHYLVKSGCSKFLPITGFVTITLLRFGVKVKRAYFRENFLPHRPLSDMCRFLETIFYVSTGRHPGASARDTIAFLEQERDARNASSSGACVHVCGAHFQHKFWQF